MNSSLVTWSSSISGKVKSDFKIIRHRLTIMPIVTRVTEKRFVHSLKDKVPAYFHGPHISFHCLIWINPSSFTPSFLQHLTLHMYQTLYPYNSLIAQCLLTLLWFCTCYFFCFFSSHPTGKIFFSLRLTLSKSSLEHCLFYNPRQNQSSSGCYIQSVNFVSFDVKYILS